MKVHPLAAEFPMLPEDEFADLVESVAANGLRNAIVLDQDGVLLDGRNRLAACEKAGVEPRFETLPKGEDPRTFIIDQNVRRRQMKKGQQAIVVAMAFPEGDKPIPGKKGRTATLAESARVSGRLLRDARSVVNWSLDLARDVMLGRTALDVALRQVAEAKRQASSTQERYDALRASAPDLAALVDDERMTLPEAEGAAEVREEQRTTAIKQGEAAAETLAVYIVGKVRTIQAAINYGHDIRIEKEDLDEIAEAFVELKESMKRKAKP